MRARSWRTATAVMTGFVAALLTMSGVRPPTVQAQPNPPPPSDPARLFDFEQDTELKTDGATAKRDTARPGDVAANGQGCLRLEPSHLASAPGKVSLPLSKPTAAALQAGRGVGAWFKSTPTTRPVRLRWLAENERGQALFQRPFSLDYGPAWTWIEAPFVLWRWGDYVGDWAEVTTLALQVEGEADAETVWVDDVSALPEKSGGAWSDTAWLNAMAFGEEPREISDGATVRLVFDRRLEFTGDESKKFLERFAAIPTWLKRVFGDAVRPVTRPAPVTLLMFMDRPGYEAFVQRLGVAWRAQIAPPKSDGYNLQEFALSFFDAEARLDRPVLFHEFTHACVARWLRLPSGQARSTWIQEGIANYLQLCVYPKSFDFESYQRAFSKPVGDAGLFRPLNQIFTRPVGMPNYAQLASLVAFMVEKRPEWLRAFAAGIANGGTASTVLDGLKVSAAEIEKEWLAWGQVAFGKDAKPPAGPDSIFVMPAEWAEPK